MNITGNIKLIGETKEFGSNGFKKRELVIETDDQYPQTILIEFVQKMTGVLNKYSEGQAVDISINLRGREWVNPEGETKYFNSIQGWKIEEVKSESAVDKYESEKESKTTDDEDLPY